MSLQVTKSASLPAEAGCETREQWRGKGVALGAAGPGRHFADQKLIFERNLKVLVFRHYFKYIFKCSTAFHISCLEALDW